MSTAGALSNVGSNVASSVGSKDEPQTHEEGPIAKSIERQTSKVPSDVFLWLAMGSIAASATLQVLRKRETSNFVGQWAPTFLILGLYNKMVKLWGSDGSSDRRFSSRDSIRGTR